MVIFMNGFKMFLVLLIGVSFILIG